MKFIVANDEFKIIDNLSLRNQIFVNELKMDMEFVFDFNDQISTLFNIYEDNKIIACCRMLLKNGIGKIEFLGVLLEARNMGVGTFLIDSIYQYLEKNTSIVNMLVYSPIDTINFFEKKGFY